MAKPKLREQGNRQQSHSIPQRGRGGKGELWTNNIAYNIRQAKRIVSVSGGGGGEGNDNSSPDKHRALLRAICSYVDIMQLKLFKQEPDIVLAPDNDWK